MPDSTRAFEDAKKTWRYLRLAIVVMVVGLAVSIGGEVVNHDCWQTSISAYFHTPARGFFVGTMVAIGVALVSLRGNNDVEDVLLNLAGGFAPVVALVPTGAQDEPTCNAVPAEEAARAHIVNNMTALLAVSFVALVAVFVLLLLRGNERLAMAGWGVAALVWLAGLVTFLAEEDWFVSHAHSVAAGLMFACIVAVVFVDAFDFRTTPGSSTRNRYFAIGVAMLASVGAAAFAWKVLDWDYVILGIEAALIALFAFFWLIQTFELWNRGLRR